MRKTLMLALLSLLVSNAGAQFGQQCVECYFGSCPYGCDEATGCAYQAACTSGSDCGACQNCENGTCQWRCPYSTCTFTSIVGCSSSGYCPTDNICREYSIPKCAPNLADLEMQQLAANAQVDPSNGDLILDDGTRLDLSRLNKTISTMGAPTALATLSESIATMQYSLVVLILGVLCVIAGLQLLQLRELQRVAQSFQAEEPKKGN